MTDDPDLTRWSHTSGEAEALQAGHIIAEAKVHINDQKTMDLLIASGSSGTFEEGVSGEEKEIVDMKRVIKEKERQMREEKRKQDEK